MFENFDFFFLFLRLTLKDVEFLAVSEEGVHYGTEVVGGGTRAGGIGVDNHRHVVSEGGGRVSGLVRRRRRERLGLVVVRLS